MELPSVARENPLELRKIADDTTRHIHALQALKRPTSHWDDLLVYILTSKLDTITLREWQSSLSGAELPTLQQFSEFIAHRCQILEATKASVVPAISVVTCSQVNIKRQTACVATVKPRCNYCRGKHSIYNCKDFLSLPVTQRETEIRNLKLCTKCLHSEAHTANKCTSGNCKICHARHNTLLHVDVTAEACNHDRASDDSNLVEVPAVLSTHASNRTGYSHIMLSTALICAFDNQGRPRPCYALFDSASQVNFISREFLNTLELAPHSLDVQITGINKAVTNSTQVVSVKLKLHLNSCSCTVFECVVTEKITSKLSVHTLKSGDFVIHKNFELMGSQNCVSFNSDVLIGAELSKRKRKKEDIH
ncbi:uncharacterized protein LOC116842773 [Odontomachus brunneus]|uniref:uncharacterized protein LOC116842773 n=1 Tax=Odontomachus brunneus TaxID=486640 RepID=UPI0013F22B25|nr:uncharacterized protein LOC116842773 [Odontomachus brunneus]